MHTLSLLKLNTLIYHRSVSISSTDSLSAFSKEMFSQLQNKRAPIYNNIIVSPTCPLFRGSNIFNYI